MDVEHNPRKRVYGSNGSGEQTAGNRGGDSHRARMDTSYTGYNRAPVDKHPSIGRELKELKYFDHNLGETAAVHFGVGLVRQVNIIPVGAGNNQRVGKRINLHSFQMRYSMRADNNHAYSIFTVLVVYDKRPVPSTSVLSAADVINSSDPIGLNNPDNERRFRVIKRETHKLIGCREGYVNYGSTLTDGTGNIPSSNITSDVLCVNEFYILLDGLETVYKAIGTGSVQASPTSNSDVEEGALYVVLLCNSGDSLPLFKFNSRVRYTE